MTQHHPSSDIDLNIVAQRFNAQSIPHAQWTHELHLAVGCWHIHSYPFYDALCRMRAGIILLNVAHGTPNSQDKGYHETLTWFWLTVLDLWITNHPGLTLTEQYQSFLQSPAASKHLPKVFYTEHELKDPATRAITLRPTQQELSWKTIMDLEPIVIGLL